MKVLLRLALLTLCGAAGILIAAHVAGPRPKNVAAVTTAVAPKTVGVPASAGPKPATKEPEPPQGGTPPGRTPTKDATPTKPKPRIAAQFPDTAELPEGIDSSLLTDLSDEQLQG